MYKKLDLKVFNNLQETDLDILSKILKINSILIIE